MRRLRLQRRGKLRPAARQTHGVIYRQPGGRGLPEKIKAKGKKAEEKAPLTREQCAQLEAAVKGTRAYIFVMLGPLGLDLLGRRAEGQAVVNSAGEELFHRADDLLLGEKKRTNSDFVLHTSDGSPLTYQSARNIVSVIDRRCPMTEGQRKRRERIEQEAQKARKYTDSNGFSLPFQFVCPEICPGPLRSPLVRRFPMQALAARRKRRTPRR